jgi:hypothetical protein
MPSVVIITEECYLLAEAINYIVINEDEEGHDDREYMLDKPGRRGKKGKRKRPLSESNKAIREYIQERKPFVIVINFIAKGAPPNGGSSMSKHSGDNSGVQLKVMGLRRTLKAFRSIVGQLREQIPDEKFLDTLVDRFLTSTENEEEMIEKMGIR